jgi:hypothetical protein
MASAALIKGDSAIALAIYSSMPKEIFSKPQFGLNYAVSLKFAGKSEESLSLLMTITNSTGELKEYAQKVENYIRN